MKNRVTSNNIQSLNENEIFVFGSNLSGIHGGGAARLAHQKFKAEWGKGIGFTGNCYAIPTKSKNISRTLAIEEIELYVTDFIKYARQFEKVPVTFFVTEIGCGLAGYSPKDIAPLFKEATPVSNIHLPESFWNILNN